VAGDGVRAALSLLLALAVGAPATAQVRTQRLPRETFDVIPPSDRVRGGRGDVATIQTGCRVGPLGPHTRRRIVDIAVQEWAFFGYQTLDLLSTESRTLPGAPGVQLVPDALNPALAAERLARRSLRLGMWEDESAAFGSVAGYWTAAPDGPDVLSKQNKVWNDPLGRGSGWLQPWSAAFVSWAMCEAGLGKREVFARSIAHWEYVDQAIATRDHPDSRAAYVARDLGEAEIVPGDLLCNARGEAVYRTLADRAVDKGRYAPLHCDIVVKVDPAQGAIMVIGGNVLNSVSLSVLKAETRNGRLAPVAEDAIDGARRWFAHLSLRTGPIEANALDASPTVRALAAKEPPPQ
jgi:hypothetical protein